MTTGHWTSFMWRTTVAALMLAGMACVAHASGPRAALNDMEASMLVTGSIDLDPEGRVQRFELDQRERLPAEIDRLLVGALPHWRFEPTAIDGVPTAVRTSMRIRVVANRSREQPALFAVRIASASFGGDRDTGLRANAGNAPPAYPLDASWNGVQATVYLLIKVGRAGNTEDVAVEQVNLQLIAAERDMRRIRSAFERSAVAAARDWTFAVPSAADVAGAAYWIARVPVDFVFSNVPQPGYGEWTTYVPGPRRVPPWAAAAIAVGADSFVANEVYLVGTGPKLLTPLGG